MDCLFDEKQTGDIKYYDAKSEIQALLKRTFLNGEVIPTLMNLDRADFLRELCDRVKFFSFWEHKKLLKMEHSARETFLRLASGFKGTKYHYHVLDGLALGVGFFSRLRNLSRHQTYKGHLLHEHKDMAKPIKSLAESKNWQLDIPMWKLKSYEVEELAQYLSMSIIISSCTLLLLHTASELIYLWIFRSGEPHLL
jgi:hypothetical protein